MSSIEALARMKVAARKTPDLIADFILTGSVQDPNIATVRGWIMDELKKRDPVAYDAWLDDDRCTDESLHEFFHC